MGHRQLLRTHVHPQDLARSRERDGKPAYPTVGIYDLLYTVPGMQVLGQMLGHLLVGEASPGILVNLDALVEFREQTVSPVPAGLRHLRWPLAVWARRLGLGEMLETREGPPVRRTEEVDLVRREVLDLVDLLVQDGWGDYDEGRLCWLVGIAG